MPRHTQLEQNGGIRSARSICPHVVDLPDVPAADFVFDVRLVCTFNILDLVPFKNRLVDGADHVRHVEDIGEGKRYSATFYGGGERW